jgi:hypothetical protein
MCAILETSLQEHEQNLPYAFSQSVETIADPWACHLERSAEDLTAFVCIEVGKQFLSLGTYRDRFIRSQKSLDRPDVC